MKISAKVDYACRSLLELALHWPDQSPLRVNAIAQKQGIPMKFLIHILIGLKERGLVKSMRGKKGGYLLAKPPQEISLSDLLRIFPNETNMANSDGRQKNVTALIWQEINESLFNTMKNINFEDICTRARSHEKNFIYEI